MVEELAHLGLVDDQDIELDLAALEVAALDHPGVLLDPYLDTLDALAERAEEAGHSGFSALSKANILASIIGEEEGFVGDRDDYDNPANADMIDVIDRRRGLPVTLSILYVATARKIGWAADALNTPGHVLVRIGPEQDPVLVDPFDGGTIVDTRKLSALLQRALGKGVAVAPEFIAPMPNRLVLVRLLMNQATRAENAGQTARALELYKRVTTIAPSHTHGWWERARLEVALSRLGDARASLAALLEVTRDPQVRAHVSAALDGLAGRSV
jgi:regulator of sirC expression with transglutaminase-like and TPR domain